MALKDLFNSKKRKHSYILVTGGTGYIGSQLIPALSHLSYPIRYTARNLAYKAKQLSPYGTPVKANFSNSSDKSGVFKDVKVAFYLMHALNERKGFRAMEEKVAKEFAKAAKDGGVERIIYLGGLVNPEHDAMSAHMETRLRVGEILRSSGIQVIELRASVILGAGSLSFELIRSLVERLPLMVTPKWVSVKAQPIYVRDVIEYLVQSVELPVEGHRTYEVGGREVMSYMDVMKTYAKERGLNRRFIRVPFITPFLSSLWLSIITPLYSNIGRKLIESIVTPSVVNDTQALKDFSVDPIGVRAAIHKSLEHEEALLREQGWVACLSEEELEKKSANVNYHNRIIEYHSITLPLFLPDPFGPIERIGGETGWYYLNFLWKLRGWMDECVGGVGLRRGRPDIHDVKAGDTIDWWRVEIYEPGQRLRLRAEMKVPGRAWLEFQLVEGDNSRKIVQTVVFDPLGLWGLLYWYSLVPIHQILFGGMLRNIKKAIFAQADTR